MTGLKLVFIMPVIEKDNKMPFPEKHTRGKECDACCCNGPYFHEGCSGFVHEKLVDDTPEEGYVHIYRCEKCDWNNIYMDGFEDEDKIIFDR